MFQPRSHFAGANHYKNVELGSRIEQILPCHLAVEYCFVYLLWQELEALLPTWMTLEAQCPTWAALEAYGGESVE